MNATTTWRRTPEGGSGRGPMGSAHAKAGRVGGGGVVRVFDHIALATIYNEAMVSSADRQGKRGGQMNVEGERSQ